MILVVRRDFVRWWKWFASVMLLASLLTTGCRDRSQQMQEYLTASSRAWGFRGSVLIAYRGETILAEGYGPADQVFDQLNTPETKFFIGSITKQFTAAAVLKLREQGKLMLNDPIADYLPDYPALADRGITIHHLLTHSSGLPNYTDIPEINWRRTQGIRPRELMHFIACLPQKFDPGADFEYSNSGYIVLGAIIEAASGQSYEAYLHHEILKPCGMFSTGYARREAAHPGRADGYTVDGDWRPTQALSIDYGILYAAGALYSTVMDMLSWERSLGSGVVLSDSSLALMFADYGNGYGYGWAVEKSEGHKHAFHGGFIDGFNCAVDWWLDDSLFMVVFSNEDEAPVKKIARGLASICFRGEPQVWPVAKTPVPIEADQLSRYEGVYHQEMGGHRYVFVEEYALWFQQPQRQRERLYYEGNGLFFLQSDNTVLLQFLKDGAGRISGYQLLDEGMASSAKRVDDDISSENGWPRFRQPVDSTIHDRFVGRYGLHSQVADEDFVLWLRVSRVADHMYASVANFELVEIFPISDSEFVHETVGFRLIFQDDPPEGVTRCRLRLGDQEVSGHKVR